MLSGTTGQKLSVSCANVEDIHLIVGTEKNEHKGKGFIRDLEIYLLCFVLFRLFLPTLKYLYITWK